MRLNKEDLRFLREKADECARDYLGLESAVEALKERDYLAVSSRIDLVEKGIGEAVKSTFCIILHPLIELAEKRSGELMVADVDPSCDDRTRYQVRSLTTGQIYLKGDAKVWHLTANNEAELEKLFESFASYFGFSCMALFYNEGADPSGYEDLSVDPGEYGDFPGEIVSNPSFTKRATEEITKRYQLDPRWVKLENIYLVALGALLRAEEVKLKVEDLADRKTG